MWCLLTFSLKTVLKGHTGSVLGLTLSADEKYLFSCSGDGTIRVWNTETLTCTYIIQSCRDVGDIFSVAYCDQNNLLFFGSQNTSIQVNYEKKKYICFLSRNDFFFSGMTLLILKCTTMP